MSEPISTTVVNILSSVTTLKSGFKLLAVALCLVLTWKYVDISLLKISTEQKNLIMLLTGVGSGLFISEGIFKFISFFKNKYDTRQKRKTDTAEKAKNERENKALEDERNEQIRAQFQQALPHFYHGQLGKLRELSKKNITLNVSEYDIKSLINAGFIEPMICLSSDRHLTRLNPLLVDLVKANWQAEIERKVDEFFGDSKPDRKGLLELMENNKEDDTSSIKAIVLKDITPYSSCIYRDKMNDGFWLSWHEGYREEVEKRTGKKLQEDVWIAKGRVKKPKSSLPKKPVDT